MRSVGSLLLSTHFRGSACSVFLSINLPTHSYDKKMWCNSFRTKFFLFSSVGIVGGGLIDIPILLSINASNTFHFFSSTGLCISAVVGSHKDHLVTTCPLALRIHWAISLPSPRVGPRTHPSTSRLRGNAAVCLRY